MDTYEKKYKNALTIAQSRFKIEKDESVLTCLGMMFPELRESEDEAIRKSIVATIEQCPDDFLNPKNRDRMLEWLEKQKEHHIPWYDYQKSKEAGYTIVPNEEYERLIKQKEQEPQVFCEAKAYDLGYKQGKEDAIKEQKPAEWSEEDEYRIRQIERIAQQAGCTQKLQEEIHDWLKSLGPQPKQEWSKADENKIERLAFLVSVAAEKEMISEEECIDLRRFVKSYRPSWKPNEELLEALHIAAYIREIEFYGGIKDKLRQLYEQLKTLI